jgi:hypothetical protein
MRMRSGSKAGRRWATDPLKAAFARVLIEPAGDCTRATLAAAARAVRGDLQRLATDAIVLLEPPGIALWVPLANAPDYPALRAWLHANLRLDAFEPDIRISVRTNAPGEGSSVPYALLVRPALPMVTPIRWDDLETATAVTAATREAYFGAFDDVFAGELARIPKAVVTPTPRAIRLAGAPHMYAPRWGTGRRSARIDLHKW